MSSDPETPRWLYQLLLVATAYVFFSECYGIVEVLARRDELARVVPARYGGRMFIRPFVISALALYAWWGFFRTERPGARAVALVAGMFLTGTSIVMWLSMQVSDWHYSPFRAFGYPVCALICCIYVIFGRERQ